MSMDSTPFIMNLTGKRFHQYTDDELWTLLESREREIQGAPKSSNSCNNIIESSPWFSYSLINEVFYIKLTGGNEEESYPANINLPLKSYEWFTMELWDYRELTEEDRKTAGMTDQIYKLPNGEDFFIKLNVHIWPHQAIDPRRDERFKNFDWSKKFRDAPFMGYSGKISPSEFAHIVRYCDSISDMKAFW